MPPIFAADRHGPDIAVFRSVAAAEGFLEPVDVRNEENEVYDAEGRRLLATLSGRRTILRTTGDEPDRDALASRLREFFDAARIDPPPQSDWKSFVESSARAIEQWEQRR
jgi:hypothetical protein